MVNKKERSPLTSETTFCPNFECPARGQVGEGNIGVHSQKDRRYICRECKGTFSATTGTVFYRLRKGADLLTLVVKCILTAKVRDCKRNLCIVKIADNEDQM